MSTSSRLTSVYNKSEVITFDDTSKFIILSDCHRGDNSSADDFAPNKGIYKSALNYYYKRGYTYIEIGDGDELWENDHLSELFNAHWDAYLLLRKFHRDGRLLMIWGNHDIYKKNKRFVKKNLHNYYNRETQSFEPLFDSIKLHEGLILSYRDTPHNIFIVHGHQGDLLNDLLWPLARFLVRYIWRYIQLLRFRDLISPARNDSRMFAVEDAIMQWVRATGQMVIAGHTHHAMFPNPGETPYFNDGCCVYKGYITGIEIQNGEIMLVKWSKNIRDQGEPAFTREILAGPERIESFFPGYPHLSHT